jgi:hypothetical protein
MVDDRVKRALYDFIRSRGQGVIATAGSDGKPEAALMDLAVTPELEIIFETTDQTRKFTNLRHDDRVALVVGGWDGGETLQYDGVAQEPEGNALDRARSQFFSAFPQKLSHQNWPGNHYFLVRPLWVRFSNYHPPRKVEEFRFVAPETPAPGVGWWPKLLRGQKRRQRN